MPLSGGYYYPVTQKPNSSYPSVDMRAVASVGTVDGLGRLYVLSGTNDLYYRDPNGNEVPIAAATGSSEFDIIDVHGYIDNTQSHLILSSSAGSIIHISGSLEIEGQTWSSLPSIHTPTGTTQTIDWNDGNSQILDLESATGDVTLTLSNGQSGASYILKVIQDSTTLRDVLWPASVLFPGGVSGSITSGSNNEDIYTFWFDGTNYYANVTRDFS